MIRWSFRLFRTANWLLALILTGIAVLSLRTTAAQAQTPQAVTDDDVNRIASELYCPVCQNVTLDVCPTTACDRWRADIRSKLQARWSDQAIQDYFIQQFGARVIGTPPRSGFNWLLYAAAPAGALALAAAAFFVLRRKPVGMSGSTAVKDIPSTDGEPWREKLEKDIHKDDRA